MRERAMVVKERNFRSQRITKRNVIESPTPCTSLEFKFHSCVCMLLCFMSRLALSTCWAINWKNGSLKKKRRKFKLKYWIKFACKHCVCINRFTTIAHEQTVGKCVAKESIVPILYAKLKYFPFFAIRLSEKKEDSKHWNEHAKITQNPKKIVHPWNNNNHGIWRGTFDSVVPYLCRSQVFSC